MSRVKLSLWTIVILLNLIGLMTLYSATAHASLESIQNSIWSQLTYSVLAIVCSLLMIKLPKNFWHLMTPWIYLIAVAALGWSLVSGRQINHAASWIQIAGFSIQPSELFKIALVLTLARILQYQRREHPLQEVLLVIILTGLPIFLILQQPDLGSALTLIPVILALCHTAGYDLPHLGILIAVGTLTLMATLMGPAWDLTLIPLHDYQISRVIRLFHQDNFSPLMWLGDLPLPSVIIIGLATTAFIWFKSTSWRRWVWISLIGAHLLPIIFWISLDTEERAWRAEKVLTPHSFNRKLEEPQLLQAKYALGNGGALGQGWLQGEQTQYQRLAYNYSDLIFASLAEEWGLAGSSVVLLLFALLIACLIVLAQKTSDPFASLCVYGVAYLFASQVFIHVGYTVGLIPMTGITLPFFSAGGSSLIVAWASVGLCSACVQDQ